MISLVVPCWNYAAFLGHCLESIEKQTVLPAEVILVDDASTDETRQVFLEWRDRVHKTERWADVPLIYVASEDRRGFVRSVNHWLSVLDLHAEWVALVSADDWIRRRFVEKHATVLEARAGDPKLALVWCVAEYVSTHAKAARKELHGMRLGAAPWDPEALERGNYIHGSACFRLSVFRELGGFPDVAVEEDHALWKKVAAAGYYGVPIPEVLYGYRLHERGHRNFGQDEKRAGARGRL